MANYYQYFQQIAIITKQERQEELINPTITTNNIIELTGVRK